jgi:peptide/nickel transport system substrate-binding protein
MPALLPEDILPTKKDIPDLLMVQDDWPTDVNPTIRFGIQDANSPFRDVRVRQAISMLIDREAIIRAFRGVELYAAEGIPVETRWLTHGGVDAGLQVNDKDFGPNAKYYQYQPEEARKLLNAAGYASGFSTDVIFSSTSSALHPMFSAIVSFIDKGGIKTTTKVWDFNTEFNTKVRRGRGVGFNGMAFDPGTAFPLTSYLWRRFNTNGTVFPGFDPDGRDPARGDPKVNDLTSKMLQEFDPKRRQELINEFLRYMAQQMYEVPAGGHALGYQLAWPAVGNAGVFRGVVNQIERDVHLWLDTTRKPLA